MIRPRLIVFLMMESGCLRKSIRFKDPIYIGDPLNTIRIFSEFEADEVFLADIGRTRDGKSPDFDHLAEIASFARMPLCYGGGVRNLKQIDKIISLGIEKVSICSYALQRPEFIREASSNFGRQSIVVCLDIKKCPKIDDYYVYVENGTMKTRYTLLDAIHFLDDKGVGEIFINNIDLDGTYLGFDEAVISEAVNKSSVPISVCGGAKSLENIQELWLKTGVSGIAAGSLWSFFGSHGAVLPNYPSVGEKRDLVASHFEVDI